MVKKTVLITGITGSIGKATALELAKNNCQLILLGRNADKLTVVKSEIIKATGNNDIDIVIADLGEPKSIKRAVDEIKKKYTFLNALVNIAAIYRAKRVENSSGLELMFATNHLGPFILTTELLDLLKAGKPARIVNVAAPSFTKLKFDDLQGKTKFSALSSFGGSKMMNLLFTFDMAKRLEGSGVKSAVFHPGAIKSELTNEMPGALKLVFKILGTKPDKAAKMLCSLAIDDKYENINGKFYKFDGKEIKSNPYAYDKANQEKLWAISEQLGK